MPRTVTRSAIRTRAQQLANVENDPSFGNTEANGLINLHMPAVYDFLVAAGPADYYASDYDLSVVAGTSTYALPDDFLSLVNVWVQETDEWRRPLDLIQDRQRQAYRAPLGACTLTLEYIPTCPTMDEDGDTFDGVDGWDELLSAKVARDLLLKREGDVSAVMAIIAMAEKRIRSFSTARKRGGPKYVVDVESDMGWPNSKQVDAYRLRAGNIEVYSSLWGPFA